MTAVVGVSIDGAVWLGADRCAATDRLRFSMAESKLVDLDTRRGALTFGFTTSFRFGQILRFGTDVPADLREAEEEYLVRDLVPAIRASLSTAGWLLKENEREEVGEALIGYRGRLFSLHSDLSIQETASGLNAVGSGSEFALGAMYTALQSEPDGQKACVAGLRAAHHFNPYVMEPFDLRLVVG